MFEIETKFVYTPKARKELTHGRAPEKTQNMHDVYYDNEAFDLMSQDIWLRKRDGEWEVKIPQHAVGSANTREYDNYKEIEGEPGIMEALGLSDSLENLYSPVADFVTKRDTYNLDDLTVVFDESDFGHFVGEVEMLVPNQNDADEAHGRIAAFCKTHALTMHGVHGKVCEFIKQKYPNAYQMLVDKEIFRRL